MRVLGVDVGLRVCGYVICDVKNLEVRLLKEGQIKPDPQRTLPQKINQIFEGLKNQMALFGPTTIIVEKLYSHHRHPTTLGVLAQVRGAVALLSHQEGVGFCEYSPTRARKALLGRGSGDSAQVKRMAENMTKQQFLSVHTADAFSLVIAFSHANKFSKIVAEASRGANKRPVSRLQALKSLSGPRKKFSNSV